MKGGLYRVNFFFTIGGKDYSINYTMPTGGKPRRFQEKIYRLPEGACISNEIIDYDIPTVDKALEKLTELLSKS